MMNDIVGYIQNNMIVVDDLNRNFHNEQKVRAEAKASALIAKVILLNQLKAFTKNPLLMEGGKCYKFELPETIQINDNSDYSVCRFKYFCLFCNWHMWGHSHEKRLFDIDEEYCKCHREFSLHPCKYSTGRQIIEAARDRIRHETLFSICRTISPYNTYNKVFRFSGDNGDIDNIKLGNGFHPDIFFESNYEEAEYQAAIHAGSDYLINKKYCFRSECGEVVMLLFELHKNMEKIFIPCSSWYITGSHENSFFPVPYTERGKQILFNLDLIKSSKIDTVIVADTVEIADEMQTNCPAGIVWTSFLAHDYRKVDWSPLKRDGIEVILLINNHSGNSLRDAYNQGKKLSTYLINDVGIEVSFIQAQSRYSNENCELIPESVKFLVQDEFEKLLEKSQEPIYEFWDNGKKNCDSETNAGEINVNDKPEAIQYLLRPYIKQGTVNILEGYTGSGKSALAYSLCASIISGKKILDKKNIIAPKSKGYKYRKILYLDYENGQEEIRERLRDFAVPLFPTTPAQRDECLKNFIVKDLTGSCPLCTTEGGRREIMDLIDQAQQEGNPGQPVDLLVLDTYSQLVGHETSATWNKVNSFLRSAKKIIPSILITHHTDEKGKMCGFKDKLKSLDGVEMKIAGDITKRLEFSLGKKRISFISPIDHEPFSLKFTDGGYELIEPKRDFIEEYGIIVSAYEKKKYSRDAIIEMLRVDRNTHSQRIKEYREKYDNK